MSRGWVLAWLAVVAVSYALRGPLPLDETRYLSVAWEMWLRGDFLVPHLNGAPYSHKPPLLFWLFHAGWWGLGVSEWWPRLVPPLFALGTLAATQALARRLWPGRPAVAAMAPWLLAGGLFWAVFTPMTMFDMPLTGLVAAALLALWLAGPGPRALPWAAFGIAVGAGILVKGPVVLLHVLAPALLGPWWSAAARRRPLVWYAALLGAVGLAAALALAWALPAAKAGGPAYEQATLWHQTADRMVESFAHRQPWWWYLPLLPALWLPWAVWAPLWRGLARLRGTLDPGLRFALAWLVPTFAAFCALSAKQPQYLLPLFPALALLAARGLDKLRGPAGRLARAGPAAVIAAAGVALIFLPRLLGAKAPPGVEDLNFAWGAALVLVAIALVALSPRPVPRAVVSLGAAGAIAAALISGALFQATQRIYDLRPTASYLAKLEARGVPVAHVGKYHGQYQFLGRLRRPLDVVQTGEVGAWAGAHPGGYVVRYSDRPPPASGPAPALVRPYRGEWVAIWKADADPKTKPSRSAAGG